MRTPEAPRPAPTYQGWRSSVRSLTGLHTGSLGEDILLARHGGAILRLRQDHRTGQTVATLRGGTTDAAPNRIEGGVLTPRPTERLRLGWTTLTHDSDPATIRELRFLGRLSAIWIAVSLPLGALLVWSMATFMDPTAVEQLASAYFGVAPVIESGAPAP